MNLAEIRKKSQQEKDTGTSIAAPHQSGPKKEAPKTAAEHCPEAPVETLPADERKVPSCPAPEFPAQVFDPVAVLLAGRHTAVRTDGGSSTLGPEVSGSSADALKYLCFRVANEDYAVNLMDIKEIIKPREVTEVPHAPEFVEGIISLRGMIVPILDMRLRLGFLKVACPGRERFVIVKKGEGFCGLHVDEVYHVISLAQQPIERPPAVLEGTDREFVSGIGRHDERIHILMDLEKVLDITKL